VSEDEPALWPVPRPRSPLPDQNPRSSAVAPDRCCRDCGVEIWRPQSLRKLLCAECQWNANNRRLLTAERRAAVIAEKLSHLDTKTEAGASPVERH
jgi:hypothetical protein